MPKKRTADLNDFASYGPEETPERNYCIHVSRDHRVSKTEGKDYEDFNGLVAESSICWVNCCVEDPKKMLPEIAQNFGFKTETVQGLLAKKVSEYIDFDTELGLLLPAVKVRGLDVRISPIFVLIKKHLILSVHGKSVTRWVQFFKYAETFIKKIPKDTSQEDRLSKILIRLIDKNNEKNFENLRLIEEEGDRINALLIDPYSPRKTVGQEIYAMKHALISYLGSLWGSLDVVNSLRYGDSDLITDDPKILKGFSVLSHELTNNISISEHMSEVLASGLEVLQSIYNNQLQILNNRLSWLVTWLSILGTAVLVPNTLATIFGIPAISEHFDWRTITIILIVSTVVSAILAYWFVKRLMPKKLD
ncbi:MAG: magnesium transporter CorA [Candidatus Diapherotrites archaeon]|nr:magnesium transporter CorA [Candidatus Diapherotrites archaeon]